jgi:hypothetical protein
METTPDIPQFLRGHEVREIFGIHSVRLARLEPAVHRMVMPGIVRYIRDYISDIKQLSLSRQESRVSLISATNYAKTSTARQRLADAQLSVSAQLTVASRGDLVSGEFVRSTLNLGKKELQTIISESSLTTTTAPDGLMIDTDSLRNIIEWLPPEDGGLAVPNIP